MNNLIIQNAKIVNENTIIESDIYIRNGRIEKIGKGLLSNKSQQVLDVKGKFVLPGMIDANVHFRQSTLNRKTYCREAKAAVAGGITTYFDMPDSDPYVFNSDILESKMKLASEHSLSNYSYYLGASNHNLSDIQNLDPKSCCGIKVFMGGARDELLVDEPKYLNEIFKSSPVLISAHCEDTPTIIENEESYRQIYGDDIPFEFHPNIRSEEACLSSTALAIQLATSNSSKLHVSSVSTANEIELFRDKKETEQRISAEVCSQYLVFADDDYAEKGALIKCNPSIKTEVDRAALFQGLMDGSLDTIATAHSPRKLNDKTGNYFEVLSGMPIVEYSMPTLLEHYQDGIFSLELIASKTSHAVADIFSIKDRGYIREGYWADLVVVDVKKGFQSCNENVLSKAAWTPFEDYEFRSSVHATIVNGTLVYSNNKVRTGSLGKRVKFERDES